jgi:3-oxoadipate CoA-transferase alpha subunit
MNPLSTSSKVVYSAQEAVSDIQSGSVLLIGGWGGIGVPVELISAIADSPTSNFTVVSNNCGMGAVNDIGILFAKSKVSHVITTFPVHAGANEFRNELERGELQVEVTPQGTLAERLRAAGAGLGGFFTPTGYGTELGEGKEVRNIRGRGHIYESALFGDWALIRAAQVDGLGNLRFDHVGRSFSPLMAMAGKRTIVEAECLVPTGSIAPDDVHLPGIFVDRILVL